MQCRRPWFDSWVGKIPFRRDRLLTPECWPGEFHGLYTPCHKEIEENNGIGKTRDLFKKIRDTKGTFHEKISWIKDRNVLDLTEAEDIKKRRQEYTVELYKKDLHDPDNHKGMITQLEPDILECEVKWALESITMNKASGVDGIPLSCFRS